MANEQIYRVSIPTLIDIRATSVEDAITQAVKKVADAGFGLGDGTVQVNYGTVEYVRDIDGSV